MKKPLSLLFALAATLLVTGCDEAPTHSKTTEESSPTEEQRSEQIRRQLSTLRRIRDSDADRKTFDSAFLSDSNELGIILYPETPIESLPPLMLRVMKQLRGEFQGEDITIGIYAQPNSPHRIGTVSLKWKTGDMVYKPEQ